MTRVNLVTGFLGAGKTTLIQHWLRHKPRAENWAVLVNEFGDLGLDGALLATEQQGGVTIKEVPGGCLCCANGLPFQLALQQLIGRLKPQRLLIEPSGLGHPKAILQQLQDPQYAGHLTLGTTFTLVDPRKLDDERYTDHPLFNEQLVVADRLMAAKADLYEPALLNRLQAYAGTLGITGVPVQPVRRGQADFIDLVTHASPPLPEARELPPAAPLLTLAPAYNRAGYVYRSRQAEGFTAQGWAFRPSLCFDLSQLELLFGGLLCERLKGVMQTPNGWVAFNQADGVLSQQQVIESLDSRVELLTRSPLDSAGFTRALLDAAIDGTRVPGTSV